MFRIRIMSIAIDAIVDIPFYILVLAPIITLWRLPSVIKQFQKSGPCTKKVCVYFRILHVGCRFTVCGYADSGNIDPLGQRIISDKTILSDSCHYCCCK